MRPTPIGRTPSGRTQLSRPILGIFLAAALLLPAVAFGDDEDGADILELRREMVELRRELAVRDVEIARLAEALDELRAACEGDSTQIRTPDSHTPGTSRVPPDLVGRPDQPPEDGAPVEVIGRVEERELEEPQEPEQIRGADVASASEEPAHEVEVDEVSERAPAEPVTDDAASAPAEPPILKGDALYDRGYSLFHEGEYARSEAAFRRFLELHPESDLADNAQFWIGESRWARGDFAAALEGYTRTVERYPDGNKVPDALLKAGRCLENLGQVGRAIQTYEAVIVRFAGSAAALTAEERLAEIRPAGEGP